jgi:glucose/mannose-6-phosphate isomerase
MEFNSDFKNTLAGIDTSSMMSMTNNFPLLLRLMRIHGDLIEGVHQTYGSKLNGICITGVGGSAIAGDICRAYLSGYDLIPIISSRDYSIPQFVNKNWAVISISYSGHTAETISATRDAGKRGCPLFLVTSGGPIEDIVRNALRFRIPLGLKPRAALPLIVSITLPILETLLGVERTNLDSVSEALKQQRVKWDSTNISPASCAQLIKDRIPIFIGWKHLAPAAYRARCQMNENAKILAISSEIPEASHNEIEGAVACARHQFIPVLLRSREEDQKTKKRFEETEEIFIENGCNPISLDLELESRIQEILGYTYHLDLTSCFLADILGVDAMSGEKINQIKAKLT